MSAPLVCIALAVLVSLCHANASQSPPAELTAKDIHQLITSKQQTCLSITQYFMQRIVKHDKVSRSVFKSKDGSGRPYPCCTDGPVPNSVIALQPLWATYAQALDQRFNETGKLVGPLHCVPVVVKDNINTKDMPTSSGAVALRYQIGAPDAESVRNMRESGAMILAKVNLAEFAISGTNSFSSLGGETVNPYDFNATVYGSSGGTGAAIGADFGVMGLGTDTCGSIVGPSGATNLFGMRGTVGLVSVRGLCPASVRRDVLGPMTRTVVDNALALDSMVFGADVSKYRYSTGLESSSIAGVRIGLFGAGMERSPNSQLPTDPDLRDLLGRAADALSRAGASITSVTSTGTVNDVVQELSQLPNTCSFSATKAAWSEYLKEFGPTAPIQSLEDLASSNQMTIESQLALRHALLPAPPLNSPEVIAACKKLNETRDRLADSLRSLMDQYNVEVLMYPVDTSIVGAATRRPIEGRDTFCVLSALSGMPSMGIPVGFVPSPLSDGKELPVGMIVLGDYYSERLLYEIAYAYEQEVQPRVPSPLIPLDPL